MKSIVDSPVSLRAIHDHVLITDMDFGDMRTSSGIILMSDNGTSQGIHPRWGKVYAIGPDQKDISVGQWILVEHGRWTRKHTIVDKETGTEKEVQRVDADGILVVSDTAPDPTDIMFGDAI